jgi:hypothetical protein
MKDKKYKLIGIAILLVGGYLIFKKIKDSKKTTENNDVNDALKDEYIDTILSDSRTTTENKSFLQTQKTSYLKDWARAVKANQSVFTSSGVKYNMIGGKKV